MPCSASLSYSCLKQGIVVVFSAGEMLSLQCHLKYLIKFFYMLPNNSSQEDKNILLYLGGLG